ncbi:MAG: hypothetical protein HQL46_01525 [Gammaproteobacteria bacterium]|nr:hypothetical protein [Gammaproteobacteria bacterium]
MKNKRHIFFALLFFLITPKFAVSANIVIIGNLDGEISKLSKKQLSELYLGRKKSISGKPIRLYELPINSALRERFFNKINGMSLSQVNAYWARLRFSGRVFPPQSLKDSQQVIKKISQYPNSIGYIDSQSLNSQVKRIEMLE